MSTIYEDIHGVEPKIEKLKSIHIVQKYARNKGVKQRKTTEYFDMQWEAFAWAAILGFHHNKPKPLSGETDTHFKFATINNSASDIFYSLILFSIAKKGYEILSDYKEVVKTIEEYANGGFEIIFTILSEKGEDYFSYDENFLQEVIDRKVPKSEPKTQVTTSKKITTEKIDTGEGTGFEI